MGDRLRVGDRVVELVIPWARGDVLAAVHREGEIVGEEAGDAGHPPPRGPRRGRPGPVRGVPGLVSTAGPARRVRASALPLRPAGRVGRRGRPPRFAGDGGLVDCSIGTPCDPPPPAVVEALAVVGHRAGLPGVAGVAAYRRAAAGWLERRFGVPSTRPPSWPPAWAPRSSWPRPPSTSACATRPRHRAVPGRVLPDLRHGGDAGRVPGRAGARLPGGGPGPRRRRPRRRRPGPAAVGQLAGQPVRAASPTSERWPAWGRRHGVPVFSDECYAEFTWDGPPPLDAGRRGPRAWSPSTRCPSAPTWPGCGPASTPATPSWSASSSTCASTPG